LTTVLAGAPDEVAGAAAEACIGTDVKVDAPVARPTAL
jgi:hypothetical protein